MQPSFIRDLIHAGGTGGLNWHLHAYYARERWRGTLELIEDFLAQIQPQSSHLVLIGGSAGWMMPPSWLSRFERIDAYDIDPLASWLFARRHAGVLKKQGIQIHHHRQDALITLQDIALEHPAACFWFDNVLGQHRYRIRDEARVERELGEIKKTLAGRHWGSLHDVLSGPTSGKPWPNNLNAWRHTGAAKLADEPQFSQKLLAQIGAEKVWQDHLTSHVLTPETITTWIPWAFKPNYAHWLQAGWISA